MDERSAVIGNHHLSAHMVLESRQPRPSLSLYSALHKNFVWTASIQDKADCQFATASMAMAAAIRARPERRRSPQDPAQP